MYHNYHKSPNYIKMKKRIKITNHLFVYSESKTKIKKQIEN